MTMIVVVQKPCLAYNTSVPKNLGRFSDFSPHMRGAENARIMPETNQNQAITHVPLTRDGLEQLAWTVRDELCPSGEVDGKCEEISDAIVNELHRQGHTGAYTAYGQFRGEAAHPHAWVRVGDWEIDATQDQFASYMEDENELMDNPVYVGKSRQWGHTRTGSRRQADEGERLESVCTARAQRFLGA